MTVRTVCRSTNQRQELATARRGQHNAKLLLLPEPVRDQPGYRRYDARAMIELIKIRTLPGVGAAVPLSPIHQLIASPDPGFAAVERRR